MSDLIFQVGVGGAVAVLLLREVFNFLRDRNGIHNRGIPTALNTLCQKVDALIKICTTIHDMHNVRNGDGVPVWYVRRSLDDTIEKLTDTVKELRRDLKDD